MKKLKIEAVNIILKMGNNISQDTKVSYYLTEPEPLASELESTKLWWLCFSKLELKNKSLEIDLSVEELRYPEVLLEIFTSHLMVIKEQLLNELYFRKKITFSSFDKTTGILTPIDGNITISINGGYIVVEADLNCLIDDKDTRCQGGFMFFRKSQIIFLSLDEQLKEIKRVEDTFVEFARKVLFVITDNEISKTLLKENLHFNKFN